MSGGNIEVLVIEDDSTDRFWLEYALKMIAPNYSLSAVDNGQRAVDFLLKRGEYAEAPTPDVIFLDVHLPTLDGAEVLRQIPDARDLPICVLTGSEAERGLFEREFGIEGSNYIVKPVTRESLLESTHCRQVSRVMPEP
ncbi:MAG TPA: response regulator [Bryobacteraceae bacterium]|nr:response regulator [Bryobacteraceae bacterium]